MPRVQATWCIKCDTDVFSSRSQQLTTTDDKKKFVNECLPKAFDSDGKIKAAFKCSDSEQGKADWYTATF